MSAPQLSILAIVLVTVCLFIIGRWRHDMVAVAALIAAVVAGLVPAPEAFLGFGHPAVITVACVLILSSALQNTGLVDLMAQRILPADLGPSLTIAALCLLAAVLSSFMNNVGALALLMPVALQLAERHGLPGGKILMPLAFATMLGGMTTLIGTPANLIVSGFRMEAGDGPFRMFDFSPVGISVAIAGLLFIAVLGWRLVPARQRTDAERYETGAYMTEVRVPDESRAAGMSVDEVETAWQDADAQIVGLVRNEVRLSAPHLARRLQEGDVLQIEADPEALAPALEGLGLVFDQDRAGREEEDQKEAPPPARSADGEDEEEGERVTDLEMELTELVVLPGSSLQGRSAGGLRLRNRYGVSLLAISGQNSKAHQRLRSARFRVGDVLLLQWLPEHVARFAIETGCAPLAGRSLRVPDRRKMLTAGAVMALAVALAAFNVLSAALSFALGVLLIMALRVLPQRNIYEAVDWPVIVLLGALIPVAQAMESTGLAAVLAGALLEHIAGGQVAVALAAIMLLTMTLSDVMNNAATAAVMSPVAISAARGLEASADPFLMAVAISASCAFLTPIGHQNNTLILGPGGFRFGDYWRMGLPLELLVLGASLPLLLFFWPP